jgi:hypothetical protein
VMEGGVVLATEGTGKADDICRLELRGSRRPGEFDERVSDH